MGTPVRIELLDAETAWVDDIGKKRNDLAISRERTPANNAPPSASDDALRMHVLGVRCEAAAYKWAKPVKWHHFHERVIRTPDLHDFIDVKGVDNPGYNLMFKDRDEDGWAFLLVDGSAHPYYDLIGWCWGFEARSLPMQERKAGRPAHFVDRDSPLLKDPELLLLVLRERQQHPERLAAASAHQ